MKKKGQLLIELLVTIGLAAVILPALLTGFVASRSGLAQQEQRLQAITLAREGQEAVRVVRERDWTAFAAYGDGVTIYHPVRLGNSWSLATSADVVNGLTREIVISDVQRDINGNIVASGGTPDPSTKQVVTTVRWGTPIATSLSTTEYLTRFGNTAFAESGTVQPPAGGFGN